MRNRILFILVAFIFTIAFAMASYFAFDTYTSRAPTLSRLWKKDMESLKALGALPSELNQLKEIEWITPDERAEMWSRFAKAPFLTQLNGTHRLEILVLADPLPLTAVIQHHLVEISTGNSVWESARTYQLDEL